jgi:hypothetical protein
MNLFNPVGTPGVPTARRYFNYTPYQAALWQALDDVYHAGAFGYDHTRQPSPFESLPEGFEQWRDKVVLEWGK